MSANNAMSNPIDLTVAAATDESLEEIVKLRKKIPDQAERRAFLRGLYYIAIIDSVYAEEEKELVEGSACALGVTETALADIEREVDANPEGAIGLFATVGSKKFRMQLFEEMAAMTYIKGYQLATEDEAMMAVAAAMDIKHDRAEEAMQELYMSAQGFDVPKKSSLAKAAIGIGAVAAGAAVCALSAGLAAPAIGAAIGGLQGLSGIAAVNAGLAAIGGGAVAAGGGGVAAGTSAVIAAGAIAGGGVTAVGLSVKENISAAYDIKKLQAVIKQQQKDNMTKQEITENLIKAIELEKARLKQLEELQASKRDIASVELKIANLQAQKAQVEMSGED